MAEKDAKKNTYGHKTLIKDKQWTKSIKSFNTDFNFESLCPQPSTNFPKRLAHGALFSNIACVYVLYMTCMQWHNISNSLIIHELLIISKSC